jgi:hypothetical protein
LKTTICVETPTTGGSWFNINVGLGGTPAAAWVVNVNGAAGLDVSTTGALSLRSQDDVVGGLLRVWPELRINELSGLRGANHYVSDCSLDQGTPVKAK